MQLNELLEENSTKTISQKTKISEDNIEYLMNNDFGAIKKVKTLGFISILEREYHIDLSKLREDALAYYAEHDKNENVTLGLPIVVEEKSGRSKWLWLLVAILLGYASWYFLTQFDQSQLKSLLPFNESKSMDSIAPDNTVNTNEPLSIKEAIDTEKSTVAVPEHENEQNNSEK
ncbi:hypothetical protein [Sulfurovum sp.]|uniref:hypothetical protein n=1 Tax=Sulfurovum sp. TaxID=1969726 RepID=UPI0025EC6967|nr:hypothetical protein [Sulfurovum sp.]